MVIHDCLVIGGGIVGLATARQLLRQRPGTTLALVDKEASVAFHQTGRNSGVLHSGIYYKPGSLRAANCRAGRQAMIEFCQAEGVPFEVCGKVIVAVSEAELPNLQSIFERGQANGVRCERIGPEQLAELEPYSAGIAALHVPDAGIVDYPQVCRRLAARIAEAGGAIHLQTRVLAIHERNDHATVVTDRGEFAARTVVNCAGLYSDRVAALAGERSAVQIVPFRGEYYELLPSAKHLCRNLIYPVPNPSFPFLGVHFTRLIGGGVECGPNAVLAFAREGYRKTDINLRDLAESLAYSGFRRLAIKYWRTGLDEIWRSLSKRAFVRALQRLVPDIKAADLVPAPSGVRAQALAPDGHLVDDFLITDAGRVVNVGNAPSPAATAALNIGQLVAERVFNRL